MRTKRQAKSRPSGARNRCCLALAMLPGAMFILLASTASPHLEAHQAPTKPTPPPAEFMAKAVMDTATSGGISEHLIIISIDGLRPDAIARYSAHTLQRLLREGAYSLSAQTIHPSRTLPSHTSMLTGLPPAAHGVMWNEDSKEATNVVAAATIFELARARGLRTAAFFSKSKFSYLQKPGTLDHTIAPGRLNSLMATETVEAAVRYLNHERPNLLFIHIGEPDYAGHTVGWMSFVYGWAVRRADGAVARVLEEAEAALGAGNYTVIVTADHGGHGRDHGTDDPRDMTIPWIVWGRGVRPGEITARPIQTMDTAATALWLLGVRRPAHWAGQPVRAAFLDWPELADHSTDQPAGVPR